MDEEVIQVIAAHQLGNIFRNTLPKARIHDWWIVASGIEANISQFTTVKEDEFDPEGVPFIHGYCIGIEDLPRTMAGTELSFRDDTTLNVMGLYEYRLGNSIKNAEHVFVANLKKLQDAVSKAPRLQTDGNFYGEGHPNILGHQQLQWNSIISQSYNKPKKKVFLVQGTLKVDVNVNLAVT